MLLTTFYQNEQKSIDKGSHLSWAVYITVSGRKKHQCHQYISQEYTSFSFHPWKECSDVFSPLCHVASYSPKYLGKVPKPPTGPIIFLSQNRWTNWRTPRHLGVRCMDDVTSTRRWFPSGVTSPRRFSIRGVWRYYDLLQRYRMSLLRYAPCLAQFGTAMQVVYLTKSFRIAWISLNSADLKNMGRSFGSCQSVRPWNLGKFFDPVPGFQWPSGFRHFL